MRLLDEVAVPARMARLPRNKAGYPTPWFVAEQPGGVRDFRVADSRKHVLALRDHLCWICGGRLGGYVSFVIGPMCAVNRISAEPPAHRDCAVYAARVCPFLTSPAMRRRDTGLPDDYVPAAGVMIERNPGVALVWTTRSYEVFRPGRGNAGLLCRLGEPTGTAWYAQGRPATRAEALAAMESSLPTLRDECAADDDPDDSRRIIERDYARALTLVPA